MSPFGLAVYMHPPVLTLRLYFPLLWEITLKDSDNPPGPFQLSTGHFSPPKISFLCTHGAVCHQITMGLCDTYPTLVCRKAHFTKVIKFKVKKSPKRSRKTLFYFVQMKEQVYVLPVSLLQSLFHLHPSKYTSTLNSICNTVAVTLIQETQV